MEEYQIGHTPKVKEQSFFSRVYAYLGVGIAISAITSFLVTEVFVVEFATIMMSIPYGFLLLWVVEIALVIMLSRKAISNPTMAVGGFILYSIVNGITISFTLMLYTGSTVFTAFVAAAATYGAMAIVGTRTKKDLSAMGHAMRSALIGIIIVILLNGFILRSEPVDLFISLVTIAVFAGLTAYDHQMIKRYYAQVGDETTAKGLAIFCALQLYLDFINLFLAFIRIFGRRD